MKTQKNDNRGNQQKGNQKDLKTTQNSRQTKDLNSDGQKKVKGGASSGLNSKSNDNLNGDLDLNL